MGADRESIFLALFLIATVSCTLGTLDENDYWSPLHLCAGAPILDLRTALHQLNRKHRE